MSSLTGLLDLPTEIIRDHIFEYLTGFDIDNIGRVGNRFLHELAKQYAKECKFIIPNFLGATSNRNITFPTHL